jgi:hypothetical protein
METSTMTAACVRVRRGMTKNVFLPRFFLSPFAGGSRQAGRFVGKIFSTARRFVESRRQ